MNAPNDDEVFDVTVRVQLPAKVGCGGWNGGPILESVRKCLSTGDEFDGRPFVHLTVARVLNDE